MIIYDTYHDDTTDVTYHIIDALKRHDLIYHTHVYMALNNYTLCTSVECDKCILSTSKNCESFSENIPLITIDKFPIIHSKHPEFFI